MNKISFVLIISAICFALASIIVPSRGEAQSYHESQACAATAQFARVKVEERLSGMELTNSLRSCDHASGAAARAAGYWGSRWSGICRSIVLEAYRTPDYITEEWQQRSIQEFANEVQLICLETAIESGLGLRQ